MKNIKGYVFIAKTSRIEPIFGKRVYLSNGLYENFETNNLTPFDNLSKLKDALKEFKSREKELRPNPYKINLLLSETEEEFDFFKDKKNLMIVQEIEKNFKKLIGPWTKGSFSVTADNIGSDLINNSFKFFNEESSKKGDVPYFLGKTPYEQALYVLRDLKRQTEKGGLLAKIDLESIML